MTKVKEIMNTDVTPISPDDTIQEIARKMAASRLIAMPVCRNGKLLGIIDQQCVITTLATANGDFKRINAEAMMNRDIAKIHEGIEIVEAAKIMTSNGIVNVPVIRNGNRFVGILNIDHLAEESLALASMVLASKKRQHN